MANQMYWFRFAQENYGEIPLMVLTASSFSKNEIWNFVSSRVALGTEHFKIASKKLAFWSGERGGIVVGTSW